MRQTNENKKQFTSFSRREQNKRHADDTPSHITHDPNTLRQSARHSCRLQAKTTRGKTHFQLTCVDSSGRAALCSVSEGSSSACRGRSGAHGGRSVVFECDVFFTFDSVGARIRKSSGPKGPPWGTDLDNTKQLSQANNFTGDTYFVLRL